MGELPDGAVSVLFWALALALGYAVYAAANELGPRWLERKRRRLHEALADVTRPSTQPASRKLEPGESVRVRDVRTGQRRTFTNRSTVPIFVKLDVAEEVDRG